MFTDTLKHILYHLCITINVIIHKYITLCTVSSVNALLKNTMPPNVEMVSVLLS